MVFNTDLPIIDWALAWKLSGNNKELAKDILAMLIQTLPHDVLNLQQLNAAKNYTDLLQQTHKLHGALCYSGLPRLKNIIATLETDLKNNITQNSSTLLAQLKIEVDLLLALYSQHLSKGTYDENP